MTSQSHPTRSRRNVSAHSPLFSPTREPFPFDLQTQQIRLHSPTPDKATTVADPILPVVVRSRQARDRRLRLRSSGLRLLLVLELVLELALELVELEPWIDKACDLRRLLYVRARACARAVCAFRLAWG